MNPVLKRIRGERFKSAPAGAPPGTNVTSISNEWIESASAGATSGTRPGSESDDRSGRGWTVQDWVRKGVMIGVCLCVAVMVAGIGCGKKAPPRAPENRARPWLHRGTLLPS